MSAHLRLHAVLPTRFVAASGHAGVSGPLTTRTLVAGGRESALTTQQLGNGRARCAICGVFSRSLPSEAAGIATKELWVRNSVYSFNFL
eukprot:scaffold1845_cov257-Pinguiococcus_pyrenoidosus.AAC.7